MRGEGDLDANAWYDLSSGQKTHPVGADWGTYWVNRGGSWISSGSYCVTANRNYGHPAFAANILGFRVARSAEP
jgi:formylglycine-generating enzyme required for sulfatase activity